MKKTKFIAQKIRKNVTLRSQEKSEWVPLFFIPIEEIGGVSTRTVKIGIILKDNNVICVIAPKINSSQQKTIGNVSVADS